MAQVLDLRGRQLVADRTPVLLDPSGGRARVLAWVGRAVAVVFLVWLIGLVFAGLGLLPSSALPFGRSFVGQSPPVLKSMPPITQPEFAGPSGGSATTTSGASSKANNGLHAGGSGPGRTVSQSSPGHTKSDG
jgi:hypothetical protein